MGLFSRDIKTLDDLFVHQLRDIYYAEKQIVQALPEMIEKAKDPGLKQGFEAHLGETKNHVKRLEQVFKMHGVEAKGVECPAIDGIIEEADEIAGEVDDTKVLDAALIAAAQAVEHYEITRYGTLIAWAKQLGRPDCASVLEENPEEEKAADFEADIACRTRASTSKRPNRGKCKRSPGSERPGLFQSRSFHGAFNPLSTGRLYLSEPPAPRPD